ncbi:tripartite tricarboxylate transporter TctB family protein [Rhizobium sp. CG5]|uniref:tripartite tricarboxylate transporter TctB family protein n=1 Tax=Rhizobium sp. CG5 TaxID=2726076 RepID=UPI0020347AF8|nr:tripartite tricarboxylate transporter TctB family protein [Rhizobium sp. CG5]MCM2474387.1 tripartite tricarboxylate transporter TctB family protein [Rhizobium sp. CG5]
MTDTDTPTVCVKKDLVAGSLLVAFAAAFGGISWFYPFGNAAQMGPGFFPLILSSLLACIGFAVAVRGAVTSGDVMTVVRPSRFVCALLTPLVFGVLVRPLGFLPASAIAAFVGTLAASGMRMPVRIATSFVLAIATTAIFIWGLGLPLPAFPRWMPF